MKKLLRYFLSVFVIQYRKEYGSEFLPYTMSSYVHGIRRALARLGFGYDLYKDPVLNDGDCSVIHDMNSPFSQNSSHKALA